MPSRNAITAAAQENGPRTFSLENLLKTFTAPTAMALES
jgi:hypothetical protein